MSTLNLPLIPTTEDGYTEETGAPSSLDVFNSLLTSIYPDGESISEEMDNSSDVIEDINTDRQYIEDRSLLEMDPTHAYPYLAAVIASLILGVFGNVMIISTHAIYKHLRKSSNIAIINLALADLCVAAVADPMCILGVVKGKRFFDKHPIFCEIIACFCLTACICAFLSLGFITFCKYMFVCHNRIYYKIFKNHVIVVGCIFVWITAALLEMPNFIGWGDHYFDTKSHQCIWDRRHSKGYTFFLSIVLVLSPLCLMTMAYLHIFLTIVKSKKAVLKYSEESHFSRKDWSQTIRNCRTMFIVVMAFFICWTPYCVLIMVDLADNYPMWVHLWLTFLAHFHSVINFFIYVSSNREYREAVGKLLFRRSIDSLSFSSTSDSGTKKITTVSEVQMESSASE